MPEHSANINTDITTKMLEFSSHDLNKLVMSYNGPFENKVLYTLGNYIRSQLNIQESATKKLFSIFMEMAQNISYYSDEKMQMNSDQEMGVGMLVLQKGEDNYMLTTGNKTSVSNAKILHKKVDQINNLNRDDLRELKRQQRKLPIGELGGANIGLIKVALSSANPITFNMHELDDGNAFISILARVDKE